jgi:hypothetical protein
LPASEKYFGIKEIEAATCYDLLLKCPATTVPPRMLDDPDIFYLQAVVYSTTINLWNMILDGTRF